MAITGPIPLPSANFGGTLAQAPESYYNNFAKMQANARSQKILPYLLQKYKDEHGKAMDENAVAHLDRMVKEHQYNEIMKSIRGNGQMQTGEKAKKAPAQQYNMQNLAAIMGPLLQPEAINLQTPAGPKGMETGLDQALNSPQQQPEMQNQEQMPEQADGLQETTEPQKTQANVPTASQIPDGGEIVVKPGRPGMDYLDKFAGTGMGFGGKSALKTIQGKDGWLYTEYPSGKITASRNPMSSMAETPEQKSARQIQEKTQVAQNLENQKAASKLESSGYELNKLAARAIKIKNILEKNPDLTGWLPGMAFTTNMSKNPALAELVQTAAKLQADMAKYGSQRGGAAVLKWAEKAKPSVYKQTSFNLGMVNSIIEDAINDFDEAATEYKRRTGKKYPVKFPGMVQVEKPDGTISSISSKFVAQFKKDHPNYKVLD